MKKNENPSKPITPTYEKRGGEKPTPTTPRSKSPPPPASPKKK